MSAVAVASSPKRWRAWRKRDRHRPRRKAAGRSPPASAGEWAQRRLPASLRRRTGDTGSRHLRRRDLHGNARARPQPGQHHRLLCGTGQAGGHVFFSTISRNPKAYLFAVIGAEYILQLLPKGTHDYAKFIKPSELSRWAKSVGLEIDEIIGMSYNPLTKAYSLGRDTDVNYLVHTIRDA